MGQAMVRTTPSKIITTNVQRHAGAVRFLCSKPSLQVRILASPAASLLTHAPKSIYSIILGVTLVLCYASQPCFRSVFEENEKRAKRTVRIEYDSQVCPSYTLGKH